jgi:hypothetical protein
LGPIQRDFIAHEGAGSFDFGGRFLPVASGAAFDEAVPVALVEIPGRIRLIAPAGEAILITAAIL